MIRIGNVLTCRSQILIVTMIGHPQLKIYYLKPQTFKHIKSINVLDKHTYGTSLERP